LTFNKRLPLFAARIETGIEDRKAMAKKRKAVKPLPSALTVASSAQPNSQTPLAKAKSAEAEALKPPARTPKPEPPLTPKGTSAKPYAPQAAAPSSPKAPQTVKVTFALLEPQAKRVALCGGFNAWSPEATPMNRRDDGLWETSLALEPGRYEYKFVVDGHWIPDPLAHENVFNGYGALNSVVEVQA
jgi:hypothetical protein